MAFCVLPRRMSAIPFVTQGTTETRGSNVNHTQVSASIYHRCMYVSLQAIYSSRQSISSPRPLFMMPSERYVGNNNYRMCAKKGDDRNELLGEKGNCRVHLSNLASRTKPNTKTTRPPFYSLSSLSSLSSSSARISNFFLVSFCGAALTLGGVGICAFFTRPDKPKPPPPPPPPPTLVL